MYKNFEKVSEGLLTIYSIRNAKMWIYKNIFIVGTREYPHCGYNDIFIVDISEYLYCGTQEYLHCAT